MTKKCGFCTITWESKEGEEDSVIVIRGDRTYRLRVYMDEPLRDTDIDIPPTVFSRHLCPSCRRDIVCLLCSVYVGLEEAEEPIEEPT